MMINVYFPRRGATVISKYSGWIGNVFLILGAVLLGEKTRYAFLFVFTGEVVWSLKTLRMRQWDMLFICVTFGVLALRNFIVWSN